MQLIALDFETYYDKDYTLRKLSTSEYVRDRRFQAISVALKIEDDPTMFFVGDDIGPALDSIDWSQSALLAHHTHFDGLILTHRYGHIPAAYMCTLSMARAIYPKADRNDINSVGQRLGKSNKLTMPDVKGKRLREYTSGEIEAMRDYNIRDVDLCREIYDEMRPAIPDDEMDLIDLTVRMFAEPFLRLDTKRAKKELQREQAEQAQLILAAGVPREDLSSGDKLSDHLIAAGLPNPPRKPSPSHPSELIWAFAKTDQAFTALARHPDEKIAALVKGRLAVKSTIGESRAKRLLTAGRGGKRVPVYLNYCGAHTTRWSGGDKLNFQNFPRGGELRKSLLAPPGHVLVVVDSAQIEARVLAWLAGEQWLLDAFRKGEDVYSLFASKAYDRTITKADKEERQVGKTCVLGLGYSMGAVKLQVQLLSMAGLFMPYEVCEKLVATYRETNTNIVGLWEVLNDAIGDMTKTTAGRGAHGPLEWWTDTLKLPNGLYLNYPDTRSTQYPKRDGQGRGRIVTTDGSYHNKGRSKIYGGLLTENVTQALARILVGYQMLEISQKYRVVMMSHDEVVFTAPRRYADTALDFGIQALRTPLKWCTDLPLNAEGSYDRMYSK